MVCLDLGDLALDAVPSNARTTHNDFLLFHWHCDSKRDATNAGCAQNPSPRRLPWFQPCVSTLLAPGGGLGYSETEMIWMRNYVNRLNECEMIIRISIVYGPLGQVNRSVPPPLCISYALVQATVGVGTVVFVYVI